MTLDPIIYRNKRDNVFIIDIPTSIAAAQTHGDLLCSEDLRLKSCPALQQPFQSTEPKNSTAASRISNHKEDDSLHKYHTRLIEEAFAQLELRNDTAGYCHERLLDAHGDIHGRKRTAVEAFGEDSNDFNQSDSPSTESVLVNTLHQLSGFNSSPPLGHEMHVSQRATTGTSSNNAESDLPNSIDISSPRPYFSNNTSSTALLNIDQTDRQTEDLTFMVPPRSAFLLCQCEDVSDFRSAARLSATDKQGRFDIILLDPPWPNRSALRKSSYGTPRDAKALKKLLLGMDLDRHISPGGFVGIWVTNKPAYRKLVLGPNGVFDAWNVGLQEEWIWVKVTANGEPVTELKGQWRKPYEILLIGQAPVNSLQVAETAKKVERRVIAGVPDLHSRKPCLKRLVEELLLRRKSDYYTMEIFARYLVAGWFSWGNESLKYNWNRYWTHEKDMEHEHCQWNV